MVGILVTTAFVASCQKESLPKLSREEKELIEPIFNFILFEHPGAFVLFGSKPMSACSLPPRESYTKEELQRQIAALPEASRKQALIVHCDLNTQWDAWKDISAKFPPMKKFLLIERPSGISRDVFVVNSEMCSGIIHKNYPFFKDLLGSDFSVNEAVLSIQNNESIFWEKVLSNHKAMGLLFGFGEENIQIFVEGGERFFSSSENIPFGQANMQIFSIPVFVTRPNDPMTHHYEKERERIRKGYRGKDMIQTSLQRLFGP